MGGITPDWGNKQSLLQVETQKLDFHLLGVCGKDLYLEKELN